MLFTISACVIAICVALIVGLMGSVVGRDGGTSLTYSLLSGFGTLLLFGLIEQMLT